jgi:HEAT repeat protein
MSGQVSDLCGVCLYALSYAKDPEVIPAIADLLTDKDDVVRGWAAIALYRLGSSSDELRKKIEVIPFPAAATASAGARGEQAPTWVTRAK